MNWELKKSGCLDEKNCKKIKAFFDNGLGICFVRDLYMDRPAAKVSNYFLNFVKDYKLAAQSLIELTNYMK